MISHILTAFATGAITLAAVFGLSMTGGSSAGGVYEALAPSVPGITVGSDTVGNGNLVSKMLTGTCNAIFNGTSLAATSSGQFLCRVANARGGDKVFVSLPIGARAGNQGGLVYLGNGYSTTTGWIGFDILNMTGVATTSFPLATTSVQYWITSTSTPR
jgi:hypothetical protein